MGDVTMKIYYSVADLKAMVAEVHDNVSKLLSLADYCEAVVVGYNEFKKSNGMGPTGIEPATSRLRAKRSARLSYGPLIFL